VADEAVEFSATQRDAGDGAPGATAAFPYDRMTVERFREAFPKARWRDDLGAWFVPGTRAERRLNAWMSREWSGVLAHADQRGRDAFAFEPITSRYLEVADGFVVRTPYSRTVIAELRAVPWARWDPASKAWRVPFLSFGELIFWAATAVSRRPRLSAAESGTAAFGPNRGRTDAAMGAGASDALDGDHQDHSSRRN
jgi:hypothetical protein